MDSLLEYLMHRKEAIVSQWLLSTIHKNAPVDSHFLLREQRRCHNPLESTLKQGLDWLFDDILRGAPPCHCQPALDSIMRVQAVLAPGEHEAVSFIYLIKEILRQQIRNRPFVNPAANDLGVFDRQIDALAHVAMESYRQCREQICRIRSNELRRRTFVAEKMAMRQTKQKERAR